ncbi:MAG: NUDIX domain-containing protein [Anaerolineales bacterium]|jgi:8-oxo-dGTP diphosphatase
MHPKFPVTAHIFLHRGDQILMLRRYNTGYEDGNYSVVAGHLDGGETIKRAAIREAKEEVGIEIQSDNLRIVGVMHRRSNDERVDFFLATHKWSGEPRNQEPGKCDQIAWFSVDQIPRNTIPYVRRALENYRNGIWFDEYGW